jgi:ferredoxin
MKLAADASKCMGCKVCQTICSLAHFREVNPKKAAIGVKATFPTPGSYEPIICIQCGHCAEVCPAEAISEKDGVFVIDKEKCTACGTCVEECPQHAMFQHPSQDAPIKCDLCRECIAMCATNVLSLAE